MTDRRLSFGQLFLLAGVLVGIACAVAALGFYVQAEQAALRASEEQRQAVARRVEKRIDTALRGAQTTLLRAERAVVTTALGDWSERGIEALLYSELLAAPELSEVTFTAAPSCARPAQVSVFWTADGRLGTRLTRRDAGGFSNERWLRATGDLSFERVGSPTSWRGADPTTHPTFQAAVDPEQGGEPLWSDLHYSEMDSESAESATSRVVLTVQKAVMGAPGCGAGRGGVLRAGFLARNLDEIVAHPDDASPDDPHRVVLLSLPTLGDGQPGCASLVTRTSDRDELFSVDGELRVRAVEPEPALAALLDSPHLLQLAAPMSERSFELTVSNERWLATLTPLSTANGGTTGWLVGVLAPARHYTEHIEQLSTNLAWVFGGGLLAVGAGLGSILWLFRLGLRRVVASVERMANFDFSAKGVPGGLLEFDQMLLALERAKTVARAMGSQLPLELVQRLYASNEEPRLGGQVAEVTLLFTDIAGFTTLSERLTPNELAEKLGLYLQVVTSVLERSGATIDKFIGDAVMAFWNAPTAVTGHSLAACTAVVECRVGLEQLFASPEWGALPPLVTRFGLHRARVMVGYFGSHSRLSYTALGDGVNLAARLESACKDHGVTTLVSEACAKAALDEQEALAPAVSTLTPRVEFRFVGRVTLRGKTEPTDLFELRG